jgi:hypothetical protein
MLFNDRADIRWLDTAIPRVVMNDPYRDAHIALALTVAADRLNLGLVFGLGHKFGQNRRCTLVEATAVLADPDFGGGIHGELRIEN